MASPAITTRQRTSFIIVVLGILANAALLTHARVAVGRVYGGYGGVGVYGRPGVGYGSVYAVAPNSLYYTDPYADAYYRDPYVAYPVGYYTGRRRALDDDVVGAKSAAAAAPAPSPASAPAPAPRSCQTVLEVLATTPELSILNDVGKRLLAGKLLEKLKGANASTLTLFAPSNAAIEELVKGLGPEVMTNRTIAVTLLSYHLVPDVVAFSRDLADGQKLTSGLSAPGSKIPPLNVNMVADGVLIQGVGSEAAVIKADIPVCRGVVHIVDHVLLPVMVGAEAAPQ